MALSFTTAIDRIEALYVGYFGRAGDPVGTNYWIDRLNAGMTYNQIAASFAVQTESTSKYPFLAAPNVADAGAFVDQVFVNMFGHVADTAGKAYWVAQVTARLGNTAAIGNMILDVISGAQSTDITIMQNKVNVGTFFTQTLANAGASYSAAADTLSKSEIAATTGDLATVTTQKAATTTFTTTGGTGATLSLTPTIGEVINGTTGNDAINGNLLFNAPSGTFIQTVQTGDSVNAGTGNDTFTIQTNTAAVVTLSAMTGVENLVLQPVAGGLALNLINGDNATVQITTNNDGGLATTLTNINGLVATLNLTNVTGAQTYATTNTVLAGATDAIVVNVNGMTGGPGLTVTPMSGTNGFETFTFNSLGALANSVGAFTGTGVTTENFNGAIALTIVDASTTVTTVNAGGTGGVGGMTAALTWTAAAGSLVQTITGGTAADTLNMNGTWTTADVINGGLGNDTVTSTVANLVTVTTAANANVTNVETIGATDALTATTIRLSNIVGLTGFNVANGSTATGLQTLNYATGTNNLNLATTSDGAFGLTAVTAGIGTTDVLNIIAGSVLGGAGTAYGGTFTSTGAETINLSTLGGASSFAGFTMTNTASIETLVITGAQAVTFGAVTADVVNGSAMTGILTLTGGVVAASGATITGGSAADVLNGSTGADIISGGGGADTLSTHATVGANVAANDVLTGGAGSDNFVLRGDASGAGAAYTVAANVTDFVVSTPTGTDKIQLAATDTEYFAAIYGQGATNLAAAAVVVVQNVAQNAAAAAAVAGENIVKLTTGVALGASFQATFAAAIGTATVTALASDGFATTVLLYDTTNSRMDILLADTAGGTAGVLDAADVVRLVGSVNMTATDYANITATHFAFVT